MEGILGSPPGLGPPSFLLQVSPPSGSFWDPQPVRPTRDHAAESKRGKPYHSDELTGIHYTHYHPSVEARWVTRSRWDLPLMRSAPRWAMMA